MTAHRYAIGQAVRMNNRYGLPPKTPETFRITAMLPARDGASPQYRIRNQDEPYERVTTENALDEITARPAPAAAHPDERSLPMAKGQKRSNREIRKPKQQKAPVKAEAPLGSQIKQAAKGNLSRGKAKS